MKFSTFFIAYGRYSQPMGYVLKCGQQI